MHRAGRRGCIARGRPGNLQRMGFPPLQAPLSNLLLLVRWPLAIVACLLLLHGGCRLLISEGFRRADAQTATPSDYPAKHALWRSSVPDLVSAFPALIPLTASDLRFHARDGFLQASAELILAYRDTPQHAQDEIQRLRPHAVPAPQTPWISEQSVLAALYDGSSPAHLTPSAVSFYLADDGRGGQSLFWADPTTGFVCYAAAIE